MEAAYAFPHLGERRRLAPRAWWPTALGVVSNLPPPVHRANSRHGLAVDLCAPHQPAVVLQRARRAPWRTESGAASLPRLPVPLDKSQVGPAADLCASGASRPRGNRGVRLRMWLGTASSISRRQPARAAAPGVVYNPWHCSSASPARWPACMESAQGISEPPRLSCFQPPPWQCLLFASCSSRAMRGLSSIC